MNKIVDKFIPAFLAAALFGVITYLIIMIGIYALENFSFPIFISIMMFGIAFIGAINSDDIEKETLEAEKISKDKPGKQ